MGRIVVDTAIRVESAALNARGRPDVRARPRKPLPVNCLPFLGHLKVKSGNGRLSCYGCMVVRHDRLLREQVVEI